MPNENYTSVNVFVTALCNLCGYAVAAQDVIICRDETELIARAEREHAQAVAAKKKICLKPQLLITSNVALVSNDLLAEMEKRDKANESNIIH